jgi:phospholipid/cholesterol/gamma-HCH transport system ATP-binding protein
MTLSASPVLSVADVATQLGAQWVHNGVSFTVARGTLAALIGSSGTGKSVLLREIMGLQRPNRGTIELLGVDVWRAPAAQVNAVRSRLGVLFQDGALFSALTVAQNVAVPLLEQARLPADLVAQLVPLRLLQAGLTVADGARMPSELSGGMRKRAALARAIALEPEILFLDEPTSGLDPITARAFDRLIRALVDDLGITVVLVTHDVDTLLNVVDQLIVLAQGVVLANASVAQVMQVPDAWLKRYFAARTPIEMEAKHGS